MTPAIAGRPEPGRSLIWVVPLEGDDRHEDVAAGLLSAF